MYIIYSVHYYPSVYPTWWQCCPQSQKPGNSHHLSKTSHTRPQCALCNIQAEGITKKYSGVRKWNSVRKRVRKVRKNLRVLITFQLSLFSWASSSSWKVGACSISLLSLTFHNKMAASKCTHKATSLHCKDPVMRIFDKRDASHALFVVTKSSSWNLLYLRFNVIIGHWRIWDISYAVRQEACVRKDHIHQHEHVALHDLFKLVWLAY